MPTHVYANNNEIASKASEGKSIAAFPDVCFSPPAPPVGPMPLPYPNTGEMKNTENGTAKVFIKDKMSGMEGDSYFSKSMGDESATQNFNKGMITSALQGKCYFGLWSMDVQVEGKGVPRHLDMVTHNHASMSGQTPGVERAETAPSEDDDRTCTPEERLSAEFKIGKFKSDGKQVVLNKDSDFLCGNCGSEVLLHAIGNINNNEKIIFSVNNASNNDSVEFLSEDESTVMWKKPWLPDPCGKQDVEYTLSAKSSSIASETSKIKYKIKAIESKNYQFHRPLLQGIENERAKIIIKFLNGEIIFSLNLNLKFFYGTYCSQAVTSSYKTQHKRNNFVINRLNIDHNIKIDEAKAAKYLNYLDGMSVSNYFYWGKTGTENTETKNLINDYNDMYYASNEPKEVSDAVLIENMRSRIKKKLINVEKFYNDSGVVFMRKNCLHGDNCTCKYPVKFKFFVVSPTARGNYIDTVNVFECFNICRANNWGIEPVHIGLKTEEVLAHEIGHLLGFYDEYKIETVELGNQRAKSEIWKFGSNALMDGPANIMLLNSYLSVLIQGVNDMTHMEFKGKITQTGAYNFKTQTFENPKPKQWYDERRPSSAI